MIGLLFQADRQAVAGLQEALVAGLQRAALRVTCCACNILSIRHDMSDEFLPDHADCVAVLVRAAACRAAGGPAHVFPISIRCSN